MQGKRLIFLLGMHRSGTSALARMVNLLGASLGERLIESRAGINDKGFWESEELVRINEALLAHLGSAWYDFRPWRERWWEDGALASLRERARAFLAREFTEQALVALKDPRLCRTLPFWLDALAGSAWSISVVITLRDPDEVAASLCKRDPFVPDTAYLLWLVHVLEAERHSRSLPRSVVSYAALLAEWRPVAARIGRELALEWSNWGPESESAVNRELDASMRHHRAAAPSQGSALTDLAHRLYRAMAEGGVDRALLDDAADEYQALLERGALFAGIAEAGTRRLVETSRHLHETGESLAQARTVVAERDGQLRRLADELDHAVATVAERDLQIDRLGGEHTHALATIRERDAQLRKLAGEYEYALGVIREKDEQLARLAGEYEHAASVVKERDAQLAAINARLQRLREHPVYGIFVRRFALDRQA